MTNIFTILLNIFNVQFWLTFWSSRRGYQTSHREPPLLSGLLATCWAVRTQGLGPKRPNKSQLITGNWNLNAILKVSSSRCGDNGSRWLPFICESCMYTWTTNTSPQLTMLTWLEWNVCIRPCQDGTPALSNVELGTNYHRYFKTALQHNIISAQYVVHGIHY